MTNYVTDTNVGEMTEKEAIAWFEDEVEGLRDDSKYKALLIVAIEALRFQQGIVRCKDCKYITSRSTCDYWSSIEWFGRFTDDEEFCSRGERRENPNVL